MTDLPIFFDLGAKPGTTGPGPNGQRQVRFVTAQEYFVSLLGWRANATIVFLSLNSPAKLPDEECLEVDEQVARAYWDEYGGVLTPPRIRHLIRAASAGPSGSYWIHQVENLSENMIDADDLAAATELHAVSRVEALLDGIDHRLSDFQVAGSEFMADYLFLQKAVMLDVSTAEARRSPGQSRSAILEEMDKTADLELEKAMATIHRPGTIAEAIPASRRAAIEKYARARESFSSTGLFARLESDRFGF
jgi:hypothetical protein